jgi:hypothetical protein
MTDVIRQVAADILEAPEEASELMGRALSAIGDQLEKLADRIEALEEKVRGGA